MRPEYEDYPLRVDYTTFGGVLLVSHIVDFGAPFPEAAGLPKPWRMTITTRGGRLFRRVDMAADGTATVVSKLDP